VRTESRALTDARESAAADLGLAPDALRLSWGALGSVLEALELDLALAPEELAVAWEAIARAWRQEGRGSDMTPETMAEVWGRVAAGLTQGGLEVAALMGAMDGGPLVRVAIEAILGSAPP
jgi:hypothetical protein